MNSIELLKQHNEWRRGGEGEMLNPTDIGIAIDDVIKQAQVGKLARETLEAIAYGNQKTRRKKMAYSCIKFIESMDDEQTRAQESAKETAQAE
jgi:hypothetical protein